ncbi:type II toxin-antitoxin system HicA family toxin [Nostoc sp. XA010]|uniref:type II toxin-antitoxin system HicA family toxin n=1 Tax=Nostoc sp. XA010 TaxID=2780407 RepID=UPI001E3ED3AB|nr:type II toxin-antitoxin system HicA family toxin [Nostoc sp. XA010]MCC5658692.1 type II toxin-antitoxin system HicA family toxin [Nostoc sp. XA010]
MGRLAGLSYIQIIKILKTFGFVFHRQAVGSHEIWFNPETNRYTTIPKIILMICQKEHYVQF